MGDFDKIDVKTVWNEVQKDIDDQTILLVTAGPPCKDFSRIRGPDAPGRSGKEGAKFVRFCRVVKDIMEVAEPVLGPRLQFLIENVWPENISDIKYFEDSMNLKAVAMDAAEFGWINRPRIWWQKSLKPGDRGTFVNEQDTSRPGFDWEIRTKAVPTVKLVNVRRKNVDFEGLTPHDEVLGGRYKFPCCTTPATDAVGRPAPQSWKSKQDGTEARWTADGRRFAPWHYHQRSMLLKHDGELSLPTIGIREQLHELPKGYTASCKNETSRTRMVANGWHIGVAKTLMLIILASAMALCPASKLNNIPQSVHIRPHEVAARLFLQSNDDYKFGIKPAELRMFAETDDPIHHLQQALGDTLIPDRLPGCDMSLGFALARCISCPRDTIRWREAIIRDITCLATEFEEFEVESFMRGTPPHVQKAYKFHGKTTNIPLLIYLLKKFEYPGTTTLENELSTGFPMIGKISEGTGWCARTDNKYTSPTPIHEFLEKNGEMIGEWVRSRTPDIAWELMYHEIIGEVSQGRMDGPFQCPPGWKRKAWSHDTTQFPLAALPEGPKAFAPAFAIRQTGSDGQEKIRRGEDWRRSFHNSTVEARDSPHHFTVDHYATMLREGHKILKNKYRPQRPNSGPTQQHIWGHDHEGAYRQWPLSDPEMAYVVLLTPHGPCIFRHNVLLFGSMSSVWSYNRCGDAVVFLCRAMCWVPCGHYVDDYGGAEPQESACSAFECFQMVNDSINLRMKPSKAQPPAREQKIQGVVIEATDNEVIFRPAESRKKNIDKLIQTALETNDLTPAKAATLAGKAGFLATTMFNKMGRAPLKAIYARQSACPKSSRFPINPQLFAALTMIRHLTWSAPPRTLTLDYAKKHSAVVYTDAFFRAGDIRLKPSQWERLLDKDSNMLGDNGWGAVCLFRRGDKWQAEYTYGVVPADLVAIVGRTKAFIYALEAIGQILPAIAFRSRLSPEYVSFCDNEPARHALTKGFSSVDEVNALMAFFWAWNARFGKSPWTERVSSKANWADSISRFDFTEADRQGWKKLDIDWTPVYRVIKRAACDIGYAMTKAVDDIIQSCGEG
jgi:hypothetical protein